MQRICDDYGVPNLFQMPIVSELSACGDTGRPLVLVDPAGAVADVYGAVAAKVVQEVAKLKAGPKGSLAIDEENVAGVAGALRVQLADEGGMPFYVRGMRRAAERQECVRGWGGEKGGFPHGRDDSGARRFRPRGGFGGG